MTSPSHGSAVPALLHSANMSRRRHLQLLALLAASPCLAPRTAFAAPSCTLAPAMTEGPYWVDEKLNRSDVTAGTTRASVLGAVPMTLAIYVQGTEGHVCSNAPVAGVQVDIWHSDVNGEYSDVSGMDQANTRGEDFLRGYQVSDSNGRVLFNTIYPGWYRSRTPHIHVRARVYDAAGNVTYNYVTQLFFDDAFTDQIHARPPYNARGARSTRNTNDGIYRDSATPPLLTLAQRSDGGVHAEVTLGLAGLPADPDFRAFSASAENRGSTAAPLIVADIVVSTPDIGTAADIYVAANVAGLWYFNDGSVWVRVNDPVRNGFPAFAREVLRNSHTLTILSGVDIAALGRVQLYAGYGTDNLNMLLSGRYKLVHTLNG